MNRSINKVILPVGISLLGVYVILLLMAQVAVAADKCVAPDGAGGCSATIQSAIDSANAGDTVRVVAGTYTENITIDKDLTLLGGFEDTNLLTRSPRSSIVNGGAHNSVIRIGNGASVTIDGFTVTGGNGTANNGRGGGIEVSQATAVIRDNLIENNVASTDPALVGVGGGIRVYSSTSPVLISDNTIQNNIAYSVVLTSMSVAQVGFGGGVEIESSSWVTLTRNLIRSNIATRTDIASAADGSGGGIGAYGVGTHIFIDGNTFRYNVGNAVGGNSHGGGGINVGYLAEATITGNQILQNTAAVSGTQGSGGGIAIEGVPLVAVIGNEVSGNTALEKSAGQDLRAIGGGIRIENFDVPNSIAIVEDNRIIDNVAGSSMVASGIDAMGHAEGGGLVIRGISSVHVISNEVRGNIAVENMLLSGSGGWGGRPSGGGIFLDNNDSVIVSANAVKDNITAVQHTIEGVGSTSQGGGISLFNAGIATVTGNFVSDNSVVMTGTVTSDTGEGYFPQGGGISAGGCERASCEFYVVDNSLLDNVAAHNLTALGADSHTGAGGGGIGIRSQAKSTQVLLQSNVISGNIGSMSGTDGFGGGVDLHGAAIRMEANLIVGNLSTANRHGAPAVWFGDGTLTSTNDVFAYNTGGIGSGTDGAPTSMSIINDTFYENVHRGIEVSGGAASTAYVTNTIVFSHEIGLKLQDASSILSGDYNLLSNETNFFGGATGGPHDVLDQDPVFVDAQAADFHLSSGSPAIDKANNAVAPLTDFEGDIRPKDGDMDGTAQADIGADETGQALYLPVVSKSS